MARAERKVAHLALDAARVASFAAGDDPLLEDFLEYAVMKGSVGDFHPQVTGGPPRPPDSASHGAARHAWRTKEKGQTLIEPALVNVYGLSNRSAELLPSPGSNADQRATKDEQTERFGYARIRGGPS